MTSLICLVKAAWAKSGRRPTRSSTAVALKILPDAFAADPDRLARFTREAQILASLNHPNIAAIYGIEEAEGTRALVLELVEGPTLADRISQGPIPLDEALPIARQIAEALEAAHEAGVIHRDLKPANIKVREDGTVKVLDFGLAKALDTHPQGDPSESPTLTAAATQMGVIMGTAAYMSPEQAKGKAVDKRADVWAFGVVLYEMLTGTRPFVGDVSETLARVIDRDPDWNVLPHSVPPVLRNVLRQCLQKSPKKRVRDIGDVQLAMDGAFEMPVIDARAEQSRSENGWRGVVPWVAVVCLLVGGLAGMLISRPATDSAPAPRVARRFSVPPQTSGQWLAQFPSFAAVSPNGSDVVYTANGRLYHHSLEAGKSGDLLADLGIAPFFSPDGEWVAYWSEGGLRKVRLAGGPRLPSVRVMDKPPL